MKTHKHEQVYKCILKTCNATFRDLDNFLCHTAGHKDELSHHCDVCSKRYATAQDLAAHQYSHQAAGATAAIAAASDSINFAARQQAMAAGIGGSAAAAVAAAAAAAALSSGSTTASKARSSQSCFKCIKCNNRYSNPETLEHHIATTSHEHPCPHCPKVFPCERYLRRHLQCHDYAGQHECLFCRKRFKTEHYLKLHTFIHTGQKPYQCETCGKAFNRKDKVRRHALTHEKIKRYRCPYAAHTGCTRAFNRPDKLKAHVMKHGKAAPSATVKTCGARPKGVAGSVAGGVGSSSLSDIVMMSPCGRCQCLLRAEDVTCHACPAASLDLPAAFLQNASAGALAGPAWKRSQPVRGPRPRGRPRKQPTPTVVAASSAVTSQLGPRRGRGRPRKPIGLAASGLRGPIGATEPGHAAAAAEHTVDQAAGMASMDVNITRDHHLQPERLAAALALADRADLLVPADGGAAAPAMAAAAATAAAEAIASTQ